MTDKEIIEELNRQNRLLKDANKDLLTVLEFTHQIIKDEYPTWSNGLKKILDDQKETAEPIRFTYNCEKIPYSQLSHQHLSNIIWFNEIIHKRNSSIEKQILNDKFEGKRLPYKPSREFAGEIQHLKDIGCITDDDDTICYKGEVVGVVVDKFI